MTMENSGLKRLTNNLSWFTDRKVVLLKILEGECNLNPSVLCEIAAIFGRFGGFITFSFCLGYTDHKTSINK